MFQGCLFFFASMYFFFLLPSGMFLFFEETLFEWEIFSAQGIQIIIVVIFDYMSVSFLALVSLVSGSVLIFSSSYMSGEKYYGRFMMLVLIFVLSMFLLILSPNLISLLLGWDGLGVTSYLLVIFYQSTKSYNAGMVTAMTNRLGDVIILICIGMMLFYSHWDYVKLIHSSSDTEKLFIFLMILAACTKSAQIPFSAWLPAAMAAPTPVSALVHSSTLVTAGVYLLIRFNHLLSLSGYTGVLMFMGTLTMFMAGASAMFEEDMKKMIALSTLSQLGVMMMIVGAQKPILAFYHLMSHAYFKAMLFMCAGSAIHSMKDYQDIRLMGSGNNMMPIISNVVVVSNMSLCGLPFLSGFYSKDMILECVFTQTNTMLSMCLIFLGTMLTVMYSLRMMLLFGLMKMGFENMYISEKTDVMMLGGTIMLFPFSIMGSLVLSWYFFPSLPLILLPFWMKTLVIIAIFSGLLSGWMFTMKNSPKFMSLPGEFLKNMFFMPFSFNLTSTHMTLMAGKNIFKVSDSTWLEFIYFQKMFKGMKVYMGYINYLTSNYFLGSIMMYFLLVLSIK